MLPMPQARKSTPSSAMALHCAGSASSPLAVMPSSVPPMPPTSASTEMPLLWATFTTSAVFSMLMSKLASWEPSYMTEVKPASMALKQSS